MTTERPTLKTYEHVWTGRAHLGDWQYAYDCTWSDGSVTREISLPWGRMAGAVEVGHHKPITEEVAMDAFCAALSAPYATAAE